MSTQKGTLINKYTPDYVIFDLETTGISPNYDEVIEISALKVKGGEVVVRWMAWNVNYLIVT